MTPVLKADQLPAGHTHQIEHGEYKVLLTNVDGTVYAVESKCSHYALPLENAALCGHRLRCPFHHACFDVRDGRQLEAPGLDGIATFDVQVEDGQIHLATEPRPAPSPATSAPAAAPNSQVDPASESEPSNHYTYAIVGGGVAAANAVYGIREYDQQGSIVLITSEDLPPYDRTKVSKAFLSGDAELEGLPLHGEAFYAQLGVTLLESTKAEQVQLHDKQIRAAGRQLSYDKILLATGGKPRKLDLPGANLGGIYTIRDARDARRIRQQVKRGTKVVIVGGSFIGLESAMSLSKQGGDVTVVSPGQNLFEGPFGAKVGDYIQSLHEAKGVKFKLGTKAQSFEGQGSVRNVVLEDGSRLPAKVVVVGIGVSPATDYVEGIAANNDGSLSVNNHLATDVGGAYVAGDIAQYPGPTGAVRIEHWKVAAQQGRVAGRNMAGHAEPYTMLPFYWSNQQGTNLRYVGHAEDYDEILYDGEPGQTPFIAFYLKGGELQAALGVKRDGEIAAIGEAMNAGILPATDQLVGTDWQQLLATAGN